MNSIMTVDLEYDWDSDKTESWETSLNKLLDFFDNNKIKATFFVVANLIDKYEDKVKEISKKHEIASHSYSHKNLNSLSLKEIEKEVFLSKKKIESLKIKCFGFRAPFFVKNPSLFKFLEKYDYKYDSSFCPSIFPGRYFNISSKKIHFISDKLLEIPVSTFKFFKIPFSLSYSRLIYPFSLWSLPKEPSTFYLHPCEFLNKKPGKEISFFVKKLYSRNSGDHAWKVFDNILYKYDTKFITCSDFIMENYSYLI